MNMRGLIQCTVPIITEINQVKPRKPSGLYPTQRSETKTSRMLSANLLPVTFGNKVHERHEPSAVQVRAISAKIYLCALQ